MIRVAALVMLMTGCDVIFPLHAHDGGTGDDAPLDAAELDANPAAPAVLTLEPVSEPTVIAPEASQGDIMGDLTSKRGRIP